ncbi:nucleoside-diphosphate kinase [Candidatus Margulisiibacteriota bacterium]
MLRKIISYNKAGESTLVIIKPDGVKRKLYPAIMQRILSKGLDIKKLSMLTLKKSLLKKHYAHIVKRPFYPRVEEYMTSGPVVAMEVSGPNSVKLIRNMTGKTDGTKAAPGTFRGDYCFTKNENIIHTSDSIENAKVELNRLFGKK